MPLFGGILFNPNFRILPQIFSGLVPQIINNVVCGLFSIVFNNSVEARAGQLLGPRRVLIHN